MSLPNVVRLCKRRLAASGAMAAVNGLSGQLRNLRPENLPAYDTPQIHFAYLHRYAAVRAQLVHDLLCGIPVFANPAANRDLVMTSVGGGPGSDFMGIAKLIRQRFNGRIDYGIMHLT
jgi:hypothetical protein